MSAMKRAMQFDLRAELLRVDAHTTLRANLRSYGISTSQAHSTALGQMLIGLAGQAYGINPGRRAYALPCGAGKTQGVVALLAAAHKLCAGLTFAVAANTIKALCLLKRDLMKAGVPEHWIGLRHNKTSKELAAELGGEDLPPEAIANTGDDDRPFMLVSHAHIRLGQRGALFATHKGQHRSLLIWDESFFSASAGAFLLRDLEDSMKALDGHLRPDSALRYFLQTAIRVAAADIRAQEKGAAPGLLDLSDGADLPDARREAGGLITSAGRVAAAAAKVAHELLSLAERPVSVALTGAGGDAVIHFAVAVDPAWGNIAVLDASHTVRLLARGGGITDCTTAEMRSCKTFEPVVATQFLTPAGKSTQRKDARPVARLVANILAKTHSHKRVLLAVSKDVRRKLEAALEAEGVDLHAVVNGKPRISVLTWGQETSTNAHRDCEVVIAAGGHRLPRGVLAAKAAGEADNLLYRKGREQMRELEVSEVAHSVLQLMQRGTCRTMDADGKAGAMEFFIIDKEAGLYEVLRNSLPGIRWTTIDAPKGDSLQGQAARAVLTVLATVPTSVAGMSTDEVKRRSIKASGLELGAHIWTKAIKRALHELGSATAPLIHPGAGQWRVDGRRRIARV